MYALGNKVMLLVLVRLVLIPVQAYVIQICL